MADPLAGITGSVNAGLKPTKRQPQFPKGLDQHFGLGPGITGSVHAPVPGHIPNLSLGGITGHALAPKATPPNPSLRGISGSANAGLKGPPITGSVLARPGFNPKPRTIEGRPVSLRQSEAAVLGKLRGAKQPTPQGRALSSKELSKNETRQLQAGILGPNKNLLAAAEPAGLHINVGRAVENIPSSLQHTITGTIPGLVKTGEAGVEAIKGHPGNLEKIGKGIGSMLAKPGEAIEKEPVPIGLMFLGAAGGASRLAGAVARSGIAGEKAAAAASTTREPLLIYKGAAPDQLASGFHDLAAGKEESKFAPDLEIPRTYSPGVVAKGAQVAVRRLAEARGKNPNMATGEELLRHVYGGGLLGQHLGLPVKGFIKTGLVDKSAGLHEMMRRSYTRAAANYLREIKPKVGAEAVPLAVEGVLRRPETVPGDLQDELGRLKGSRETLGNKGDIRLNERNQAQVEKLLEDKKFMANPQPAFDAAQRYADYMRPHEERLVELGLLEPNQLSARNVPFAVAHRGYKYNTEPGPHPLVRTIKGIESERRVARQRFQRAAGAKDKTAMGATRDQIRNLTSEMLSHKYELQGLKDAGRIKNNGDRYPYIEDMFGREVPREQLEREVAREVGNRRLGFITHKEVTYGEAAHTRVANAPASDRLMRTGESFGKGTYRRDWGALELQAYKNMNKIAGQETRNNVLNRFGLGRFYGPEDAARAAKRFEGTTEGQRLASLGRLVPEKLGSAKVLSRGHINPRPLGPQLNDFLPASERAIYEASDGATHTLIPERVLQRINAHDALNNTSELGKLGQWLTNKWRSAALYTSPRWMIGNPQEHAIRMAAASINPFALLGVGRAVHIGKDMLDEWARVASDPTVSEASRYMARAYHAAYESGTHYGSLAMNAVRRNAADLAEGESKYLVEAFEDKAPVSATLKGWGRWKSGVGAFMDMIEKNAKAAAIGKAAINETGKFTSEWRALIGREDDAIRAWADGKLDPNQAAKLGEDVNNLLGNWSVLTPTVRRAVQTYSPFGLWWLNSMKFVFKTLPKEHPMKTAALAAMASATRGPEAELVPSYLEGGIGITLPIVGKVTTTPGYYSPAGIATEPGTTATSMLFPQATQIYDVLRNREPLSGEKVKGQQLPEALSHAGTELLTGITPGARQAISILQAGGKPDYTSMNPIATKPGTQRQNGMLKELVKQASPLRIALPARSEEGAVGKRRERPEKKERPEKAERKEKPEKPERKER